MITRLFKLQSRAPLDSARHDWVVLGTVIAAVVLLIGNGTSFFRELDRAEVILGPGAQVAAIALTLNVALILFGWRRYVDLQHETERRLDGERRAAIAATDGRGNRPSQSKGLRGRHRRAPR